LELTFSTLQAELKSFQVEYFTRVGSKYVEIDQLQAQLDRLYASRQPSNDNAKKTADASRERAEHSSREADDFRITSKKTESRFEPSQELKALYRELAKLVHPDLALDQEEKQRRHKLMQEVNDAYQAGDLKRLRDILASEKMSPERVKGDDIGSSLVKIIRKIAQIDKRIEEVLSNIAELAKSDMYLLRERVKAEREKGKDILEQLATTLDHKISNLKDEISNIRSQRAN
jgi:ElaB/YqjD/DUF883 family membrane-anchored ribosome-binding protein